MCDSGKTSSNAEVRIVHERGSNLERPGRTSTEIVIKTFDSHFWGRRSRQNGCESSVRRRAMVANVRVWPVGIWFPLPSRWVGLVPTYRFRQTVIHRDDANSREGAGTLTNDPLKGIRGRLSLPLYLLPDLFRTLIWSFKVTLKL